MRTLLLTALLFGLSALSSPVAAQQTGPSANATRYGVGVVDVSYVFKKYSRFTSQMEGMKKEMQSVESQLKGQRDAIQSKAEQAKDFTPSSPEFKRIDEEVAREKAEFGIKAERIRKEFLEKEAKVYYQTYMEVNQAVKYYAQQHNLGLVLRFNGDQIDPTRREDILRGINQPVVYQNSIDITPDVLAILERGGTPGGVAPAARGAAPARR